MFKKGFVFTGKWFKGRIEVVSANETTNELEVILQSKVDATEEDYHWYEVWDFQVVKNGWGEDYFRIGWNG